MAGGGDGTLLAVGNEDDFLVRRDGVLWEETLADNPLVEELAVDSLQHASFHRQFLGIDAEVMPLVRG